MTRKPSREISRLVAAEKLATPGFVPTLLLVAGGTDKSLKFTGRITVAGVAYEVAADNGKLKTFGDVDGFLKTAAKVAEKGDGVYTVTVDTGALLASSVPSDIKTNAAAQVVSLGKTKATQNAVIAAIDVQLGFMTGWENGNAAQQAKKCESPAQRPAVVPDIAATDAEVLRLTAIANS